MATPKSKPKDEDQVRERIESWIEALRAKDVDGVMSHCTPDVLSFDLAPPLEHRGKEVRRGFEEWFPTWAGRIGYELRDLTITTSGDLAFSHSLDHLTGKRTDGEKTDVWFRSTVCLRKLGGAWKVVHVHSSVPFYMDGSYRASVDLQP